MQKKYILVDGSGYIFRAFYALPPISRSDNLPVGAVYGFCSMLLKLLNERHNPNEIIAVIFDKARRNFRNEIYPEYKANRAETPAELIPQFAYIRKAVEAFNIASIEQANYEADDLIATYATQAEANGDSVVIYSSDKDLMQLMSENIRIHDPLKNKDINEDDVLKKFGVEPAKVVEVQALIGDSTDNIPGIKGIGPKTASELINKYGDLETLLENARNIKQDKRRQMIIDGAENARISKRLATLCREVPLDFSLSSIVNCPVEKDRVMKFLEEMEFKSLMTKANNFIDSVNKIFDANAPEIQNINNNVDTTKIYNKKIEKKYELVQDVSTLQKWIKKCEEKGIFAVDTETTGLDSLSANIVGMSIATDEGEACYIPIGHIKKVFDGGDLFNDGKDVFQDGQIPLQTLIPQIKPLLENPNIKKIGHNIKYDMHIFRQLGINVFPIEDTMVMSYVLDSSKNLHNMDELANLHLNYTTIHYTDVCGTGKAQIGFNEVPFDKALDYAAEDADITLRLYNVFNERIKTEDKTEVYKNIDLPLVYCLFEMEEWGVKVDTEKLQSLSQKFEGELKILGNEIYQLAGEEFNILSPKQLGEVLFEHLGIAYPEKNKKNYSTDVEILRQLSYQGFTIADKVLKYRELSKLKNTYTDALVGQVLPRDGRVHTNYFQCGTSTGRLSSNDPNLQNIPIRTELGKDIRSAFIASNGYKILAADYSQIELRLMAVLADVKNLKQAFIDNVDIHTRTASHVFGIPETEMTPDIRRKAKAINFGIIYGISAFGLSRQLEIPQEEARGYIESYFKTFPEILSYMDEVKNFAHKNGYVETMDGRKLFIANINNPKLKSYAERAAINAPCQGTAADILKKAMNKIQQILKAENLEGEVRMLLQVHDELVFEVREGLIQRATEIIKSTMENVVKLSVPLIAEVGVADNWKEAH